jgi:dTMP kinase
MFITFEGCEGSGKTTISRLVYDYYIKRGFEVLLTREPGGSVISEKIRQILLDVDNVKMASITEVYLYASSRAEHVYSVILPALAAKKLVICDRYLDSSLAYQGFGRELGYKRVLEINKEAIFNTFPDITFFIDVSPEIGRERIKKMNKGTDRLESLSIDFHRRVYEGFCQLSKDFKQRIVRIDGEREVEEVVKEVISYIDKRISS